MEKDREFDSQEQQAQGYVPRPRWQVWGARTATAIFIVLVIIQILSIARGGL